MWWRCSTGGSHIHPLQKLLPGPDGYSFPYLREKVNSATIYITPLQSELIQVNDSTLQQMEPSAFCRTCKTSVNLNFFAEYLLECSTSMLEEDSNTRCTFEKSEEDKNLPFRIRTKKKHRVTGGHFSAGSKKEYLREPYSGWAFLGLLTDDGEGGHAKRPPPP